MHKHRHKIRQIDHKVTALRSCQKAEKRCRTMAPSSQYYWLGPLGTLTFAFGILILALQHRHAPARRKRPTIHNNLHANAFLLTFVIPVTASHICFCQNNINYGLVLLLNANLASKSVFSRRFKRQMFEFRTSYERISALTGYKAVFKIQSL